MSQYGQQSPQPPLQVQQAQYGQQMPQPAPNPNGGMSTGAKVAIGLGAGMVALFVALLAFLLSTFSWFGDPRHDFIVYKPVDERGTTDEFQVDCDWESVNPFLESGKYEEYGLFCVHPDASFEEAFLESEQLLNCVYLLNYSGAEGPGRSEPGNARIAYGAIECSGVAYGYYVRHFTEPMIEIYLYNPELEEEQYYEYIMGYRAVYSLDGKLALEEGAWFLDEDKDKFCRKYFEAMLKAIGKGEGVQHDG